MFHLRQFPSSRPTPKHIGNLARSEPRTEIKKETKGKRKSAPAKIATSNAFPPVVAAPSAATAAALLPPSPSITGPLRSRATSAVPSLLTTVAQPNHPLSDRGRVAHLRQPPMAHTPSHWLGQGSDDDLFFDLVSQHTENLYQHRHYEEEHDILKARLRGDMDFIHPGFASDHSYPSTSDLSAHSRLSSMSNTPSQWLGQSSDEGVFSGLVSPHGDDLYEHRHFEDEHDVLRARLCGDLDGITTAFPSGQSYPASLLTSLGGTQYSSSASAASSTTFSTTDLPNDDLVQSSIMADLTEDEEQPEARMLEIDGSGCIIPSDSHISLTRPAEHTVSKAERASTRYRCPSSDSKEGTPACDFCRKRKVKCDRLQPTCSFCSRHGMQCTSEDRLRKRGPPTKVQREEMRRAGYVYDRSKRRWRPEAEVTK